MSGMDGMGGMPSMPDPLAHLTAVGGTTSSRSTSAPPRSGTTTTAWTSAACRCGTACSGSASTRRRGRQAAAAQGRPGDRARDRRPRLRRRRAAMYPEKDPTLLGKPSMDTSIAAGAQGDVDPGERRALAVSGGRGGQVPAAPGQRLQRAPLRTEAGRSRPGRSSSRSAPTAGLLAAPLTHSTLHMSPAERFDVVVDFSTYPVGSTVALKNAADSGGTGPGDAVQGDVPGRRRGPRSRRRCPRSRS